MGAVVGKKLCGEHLLKSISNRFDEIPDHRDPAYVTHSLRDILMSGFAMFSLKFPSLLKFEEEIRAKKKGLSNLQTIYGVKSVPSDTRMREVIDEVEPSELRKPFKSLFALAQRFKILERFAFLDQHYLLSVDGSGYFHSDQVHCDYCQRTVNQRDNSVRYHHEMLAGCIVHPEQKCVIPVCPEPLHKQDTKHVKNDSERSGMKRFIEDFRREHPHLQVILLADALHATAPLIEILKQKEIKYILSAKPGSHSSLFKGLSKWQKRDKTEAFSTTETIGAKIKKKLTRNYHFANGNLLNHDNLDLSVNVLDFEEILEWTSPKGQIKREIKKFTWITDIKITKANAYQIMRGGRCRWKIENETFNSLKNQGYELEHNFGHGYKNLSTNMALLMMLAFLFDQLQELTCKHFQKALIEKNSKRSRLWERMKAAYEIIPEIPGWTFFMRLIYEPDVVLKITLNTS